MAVYRETPKCPFCGKVIAKAVIKEKILGQPLLYGDNFLRWDYLNHKCKKAPKLSKEDMVKWQEIINNIKSNK